MTEPARQPLVAIVGPTASGKTALALDVGQACAGEIIAADSRTVYRRMNIGTAKPTAGEQMIVPHHIIDVVEPGEPFSLANFQVLAKAAIQDISSRGKLPLLVGGTGLYVDCVLYDYQLPAGTADTPGREALAALSLEELQQQVDSLGVELNDSDRQNPRRLIRAIETAGQPRAKGKLRADTLVIGLEVPRAELEKRICERIEDMLASGFVEEVAQIGRHYGFTAEVMNGIGYRAYAGVAQGTKDPDVAKAEFVRGDLQLAKRQMTWFKRNPDIQWFTGQRAAMAAIERFLKEEFRNAD